MPHQFRFVTLLLVPSCKPGPRIRELGEITGIIFSPGWRLVD